MSIYRLYGTATASADNIASLDIRAEGKITSMLAAGFINGADALNDGGEIEVAFGSTRQFTTNDVQNVIATFALGRQGFLTSGGGPVGMNCSHTDLAIPVSAGERIYLHCAISGTSTLVAYVTLFVDDGIDMATRPSRRR